MTPDTALRLARYFGGDAQSWMNLQQMVDCRRHSYPMQLRIKISFFMHNSRMNGQEKQLEWIGSSHKDLMALPADVRRFFGYALSLAQAGDQHDAAKVLKGFGGAGVLDIIHARLKVAAAFAKELENEKKAH